MLDKEKTVSSERRNAKTKVLAIENPLRQIFGCILYVTELEIFFDGV